MSKLIIADAGGEFIGIPSKDVAEVVELPRIYPIPFALPMLNGVAFWRGALLTVVSMARLVSNGAEDNSAIFLRTAQPDDNLLLAVDKMEDVIDYNEIKLSDRSEENVWKGLYPWNDEFATVLDTRRLVLLLEEHVVNTLRLGIGGR